MRSRTWWWIALGALATASVCCIGVLLGGLVARREAPATGVASLAVEGTLPAAGAEPAGATPEPSLAPPSPAAEPT